MKRHLAASVLTLQILGSAVRADPGNGLYPGDHMMGYGYGGAGAFFGVVFMVLVLAAIVVGIVALTRATGFGGSSAAPRPDGARHTLDLRFAKGEIDATEYAERKKLLSE